jgi:hypothetical protein
MPPRHMTTGDTSFYRFDPDLGFWGAPNIVRQVTFEQDSTNEIEVRHNSWGNRDDEYDFQSRKLDVLCMGGSHSWGAAVSQRDRYSDVLQSAYGWNTANFGHCSLGLDQVCIKLAKVVPLIKPRVVVVEQYPWAVHRILNAYVNQFVKPQFYLDQTRSLALHPVPFIAKSKVGRSMLGSYLSFKKEFTEFLGGIDLKAGYDPANDPIFLAWKVAHYSYLYDLLDAIIGDIRRICLESGVSLVFCLGTVKQRLVGKSSSALVDYNLPMSKLKAILDSHRIAYIDSTDRMVEMHTDKHPVIFNDGHINRNGHKVMAELIAEYIQNRGLLT